MAFSCGARSASELMLKGYLRSMLSRRQLQGFVRLRGRQKSQNRSPRIYPPYDDANLSDRPAWRLKKVLNAKAVFTDHSAQP